MRHYAPYEIRNEVGSQTGAGEAGGDPIVLATQAVEELRTNVEQFRTATEQRLATELRTITQRIDTIDTRTQRPGTGGGERTNAAADLERRAFTGYVRRGRESLGVDEVRALRVADDTAGGYLAPDQFVAEIIRNLVQFSPIRQAARVGQMSAGAVLLPRLTGRIGARWVGEIEVRPETEPSYGQIEITAHEMACWVPVSNQLLEDAAVDLAAELSTDFAIEFGRLEGAAFVNGTGVKMPLGIMTDPTVPVVPNGDSSTIKADALLALMYALPSYYRNRGSWLLNGPTIGKLRALKDTTGRFLWMEGIEGGQPPTLLGRPVVEAVDMPDVLANAFPIAFGDFGSAYRIYDRVGLSVLRDPYTRATVGQTVFHARRRVGGAVVLPEAIRKLQMTV